MRPPSLVGRRETISPRTASGRPLMWSLRRSSSSSLLFLAALVITTAMAAAGGRGIRIYRPATRGVERYE